MKLANKLVALSTTAVFGLIVATPVLAYGYDYSYDYADTAASGTLVGLSLLSCCIPFFIWLVVGGVLAYVVYKDAKKYNVENAGLWAVLTFFFGLLGLLVYFLAIRPEAVKKMEGTTTPTATSSATDTTSSPVEKKN